MITDDLLMITMIKTVKINKIKKKTLKTPISVTLCTLMKTNLPILKLI